MTIQQKAIAKACEQFDTFPNDCFITDETDETISVSYSDFDVITYNKSEL